MHTLHKTLYTLHTNIQTIAYIQKRSVHASREFFTWKNIWNKHEANQNQVKTRRKTNSF